MPTPKQDLSTEIAEVLHELNDTRKEISLVRSWTVDTEAGTHYDISARELRNIQSPLSNGSKRPVKHITLDRARSHLSKNLEKMLNSDGLLAWDRLREAFVLGEGEATPDLFVKVVKDLDTMLFDGVLQDRVVISWAGIPSGIEGRGVRGPCVLGPPGGAKVSIVLNKDTFRSGGVAEVWKMLVHKLLHAYLGIVSGFWSPALHRNEAFEELERIIVRRIAYRGGVD